MVMANTTATLADQVELFEQHLRADAEIVDLDTIAQRRERLLAYAERTRPVFVYRFMLPDGAMVAALGPSGDDRDARAQLQMIVGLVGGAIAKSHGGFAVRVPKVLADKFEALAGRLIEAYLVALDLGDDGSAA